MSLPAASKRATSPYTADASPESATIQTRAEVIDLKGAYLSPGFINGHIHIESSMLHPAQYARTVVPHGVTSISTDLHEITNVSGLDGIRFVMNCARNLPLDIFFQAASCVPATHMETSGASIGAPEIRQAAQVEEQHRPGRDDELPGRDQRLPAGYR